VATRSRLAALDRPDREAPPAAKPLLLRVDVEIAGREGVVPGQIVDVSGSGCRVELKEPTEKGSGVRLTLYGVEGSTDLSLGPRCAGTARPPTHARGGLKFTGTAAVLAAGCSERSPERPEPPPSVARGRRRSAGRPRHAGRWRAYDRRSATWLACWRAWRWSPPCIRTTRHISISRERSRWPIRSTRNSRRRSGSAASASSRVTSW